MITYIITGIGFLVVVAIVVGIVDAMQASAWRRIAGERRQRWEARQRQYARHDGYADEPIDELDEDDD